MICKNRYIINRLLPYSPFHTLSRSFSFSLFYMHERFLKLTMFTLNTTSISQINNLFHTHDLERKRTIKHLVMQIHLIINVPPNFRIKIYRLL